MGFIILRIYLIILKGRTILNVDVEGIIILILDSIIPKGRIILNVYLVGMDPTILEGRIFQDVDVGIDHTYT